MPEFEIHIRESLSAADEINLLGKDISHYPDQITSAISALSCYETSPFISICGQLRGVNDALLEEAAKMHSLEEALRYIVSTYSNSEKHNSTFTGSSLSGKSIVAEEDKYKNIFRRFLDWIKSIFNWTEKGKEESISITRQQEKTHDLYMQSEIFALLDSPAYNKTVWNQSTIEQRKDILTKYLAELALIYGVTVSPNINFFSGNQSTRGTYSHSRKMVSINENYLTRSDSYQIMQTVIHEMRHAYQHAAVEEPDSYEVSAETIKQWKNNFANYKSTDDGKTTYSQYVTQPVEYDAKNFAKQYTDLSGAKPEYKGSWE